MQASELSPELRGPADGERPMFVHTLPQMLPFEELTPSDFERLICRLAARDADVERAHLYGVHGQDQGEIDLYCRLRDRAEGQRGYRTVQCRRVERMPPSKIAQTVAAFLEGNWPDDTAEFVLATPVRVAERGRAEAVKAAERRLAEAGIVFHVWDGDGLVGKLRNAPELVCEFFGEEAERLFCGSATRPATMPELMAYLAAAEDAARRHPYSAAFRRAPLLSDTYWPQKVNTAPRPYSRAYGHPRSLVDTQDRLK